MSDSEPDPTAVATETARPSLQELSVLFLRLGFTAFGGPAAHIAMMQQEIVERRRWLSRSDFLDLLGAANLIPGPSSTELAIFIGYRLAGPTGLALAGGLFILPAFLLVLGLAWIYVQFGSLPQVSRALYGIKPVVIAIIAQALWNLGKTAVKSRYLGLLAALALIPAFLGAPPLALLLGAGLLVGGGRWFRERATASIRPLALLTSVLTLFLIASLVLRGPLAPGSHYGLAPLFWVFLKIGSVIYGSGYVLLAFLRADLVLQRQWLTPTQLADAISIGQVTPGPVFTTATFIGFVLGGPAGALVATVGIFLPAFVFVAIGAPLANGLRKSQVTGAFLDGVNVAAVALMAAVTWDFGRTALVDMPAVLVAVASLAVLLRFRVNSMWLIGAGAVTGLLSFLWR